MNNERGVGCFKLLLLIVFIGLIVCAAGGYYVYKNAGELARTGGSALVETAINGMLTAMEYPPEESERIMAPVKEFAEKIRNGEVNVAQAAKVTEKFTQNAFTGMLLHAFDKQYLQTSELSAEEKTQGHIDITRYVYGVSQKLIPLETTEKLAQVIQVEVKNAEGEEVNQIKDKLADYEVREFLKRVKEEADKAGIENQEFAFDVVTEVKRAIVEGMKEGAEGFSMTVEGAPENPLVVEKERSPEETAAALKEKLEKMREMREEAASAPEAAAP